RRQLARCGLVAALHYSRTRRLRADAHQVLRSDREGRRRRGGDADDRLSRAPRQEDRRRAATDGAESERIVTTWESLTRAQATAVEPAYQHSPTGRAVLCSPVPVICPDTAHGLAGAIGDHIALP